MNACCNRSDCYAFTLTSSQCDLYGEFSPSDILFSADSTLYYMVRDGRTTPGLFLNTVVYRDDACNGSADDYTLATPLRLVFLTITLPTVITPINSSAFSPTLIVEPLFSDIWCGLMLQDAQPQRVSGTWPMLTRPVLLMIATRIIPLGRWHMLHICLLSVL